MNEPTLSRRSTIGLAAASFLTLTSCRSHDTGPRTDVAPGRLLERKHDEIVAAGQYFHTGAAVVLWTDPGGYDAYRVERRFVPWDRATWSATTREATTRPANTPDSPARYGIREAGLTPDELARVRGGGWGLPLLQQKVDQFVYHYDVAGTARRCFQILHDLRGLSVHFMLDLDGTIYQTLDLKERAFHATIANHRSVGIEIANMGAYATGESDLGLREWYKKDDNGNTIITIPSRLGDGGIRTPHFVGRPARNELVVGEVQGKTRRQYDLTPQQYDSLIKLTATLCKVFPKIKCDYPKDEQGRLVTKVLPKDQFDAYQGLLGHYHVQANKSDPGPAFQWDYVVAEARRLIH